MTEIETLRAEIAVLRGEIAALRLAIFPTPGTAPMVPAWPPSPTVAPTRWQIGAT